MKKNLVAVLAMAAFLVAFTSTARADIAPFSGCATNGNVLGVTSSVCFTVVGDVLTTTSVVINGGDVVKSIDEIGWQPNTGTLVNLVSTTSNGTWDFPGSVNNIDGFDLNPWDHSKGTGNVTNGGLSSWTFDASPGTQFVFHVQYTSPTGASCSDYESNTSVTPKSSTQDASCNTQVPEPASLTLLGTGLVMLGGKLRRRLQKK